MKQILVATDGSDAAMRAIEFASTLANAFDAVLHLVNVAHGFAELGDFAETERLSLGQALSEMSQMVLDKGAARAKSLGVKQCRTEARVGDVAEEILDVARTEAVDVIVLGKRGSGRLAGLLLGSVSQKLLSLAPVPVIVVP